MKPFQHHFFYLSLGTNIGNKKENLKKALHYLEKNNITIIKKSSLYETEPWGLKEQPNFFNQVLKCEAPYSAPVLLEVIKSIEHKMGREPGEKWGPRIIDIDILLYRNLEIKEEDLIIPHPELHNRNFMLIPLMEIQKDLIHPVFKKPLKDFIKNNTGFVKILS